jgi:DNA polymerase I
LIVLSKEKVLALDTETNGGHPLINNIIMLQLGTPSGDQYIVDCRDYDIKILKPLLENKDIIFVGHNIKFDYNMLKQYGILLYKVYDTMVADQCLYNGKYGMKEIIKTKRFSLMGVYRFYFRKKIDKDTRQEFLSVFNKAFTEKQLQYGALDVVYPLEIKIEQERVASYHNLQDYIRLENKVLLALGDMEYNGLLVDTIKWNEVLKDYAKNIKQTILDLDQYLLDQIGGERYKLNGTQLSLFKEDTIDERLTTINWRSNKQVLDLLKEIFNITPLDKHGNSSSGKGALNILDPFKNMKVVKLILKHREEEKILSSFGKKYLVKHIDFDGRIRTTFNQVVSTGRVSSRKPNLQQVPKEDKHRSCFIASPGYQISSADYNSQESRIMADLSNDPSMLNFFRQGGSDLHSFVATKVFSVKFGKEFNVSTTENSEYRQYGKILNFSISYGASAYGIALTYGITQQEAQELIDLFYMSFPGLIPLFEKAKRFGLENGYIITPGTIKARRWFPEWLEYKKLIIKRNPTQEERKQIMRLKGAIERRSQNYIIQNSAGIMTKLAMIILRDRIIEEGILPFKDAPVKLLLTIHDELLIEARDELINKFSLIQKESMEKAGSYICKKIIVKATPLVSTCWTH